MIDKLSGINMPDRLGDFERGEQIDYEDENPGLGISIAYNTSKVKATIYIYNMGERFIANGINSDIVNDNFKQSEIDILTIYNSGNKQMVSEIKTCSTYLNIELSKVPVLKAEFIYEEFDTPYSASFYTSQLYLTAVNSNLIKIRISYPASGDREIALSVDKFLIEISSVLNRYYKAEDN